MLTFAYAGARFVSARKRVSNPARDDVSCDNSRAERVGRIFAASFTVVNNVYDPVGVTCRWVSRAKRARLCLSRAGLRSLLAFGMLIDECLDHRRDLLLL